MKGFGPYATAKVPDGKYLWTVVALFGLLGLLGLGVLLYKPLRLRYAIYRVEQGPMPEVSPPTEPDRWLNYCLEAAIRGNLRAMEVVIGRHWVGLRTAPQDAPEPEWESIAFVAAKAQPLVFVRALERANDQDVFAALRAITQYDRSGWYSYFLPEDRCEPKVLIEELAVLAKSDDPEVARLGVAARDFTRRRFARELAGAEEPAPKAKEPSR